MTEAQADFLRRLQTHDPTQRFVTHSMLEMMAEMSSHLEGWIARDLHGALSLTPAGLAALAAHDRKEPQP